MAEEKKTKKTGRKEEKKSSKLNDLKIELLKNPTKRKSIKREIARLLTSENKLVRPSTAVEKKAVKEKK